MPVSTSTRPSSDQPGDEVDRCKRYVRYVQHTQWTILLVSALIFGVLCGAGLLLADTYTKTMEKEAQDQAHDLAIETGAWFSETLDKAMMPLFRLRNL